jgi:hypothetical protein
MVGAFFFHFHKAAKVDSMPFPMGRFLSILATAPRFSRGKRHARRFPHDRADFGIAAEVLEDRRLLATFVVNDDGGGDFNTIQTAIDAAAAGDTILINGGVDWIHTEQGIVVNEDVMLQGTPGLSQVIVQAAPTQATATEGVFLITSGASATIDNLLIRHGVKTGPPNGVPGNPQARGGGILLDDGALILRNSTLSQNVALRGGGIHVTSGSLIVENSTFFSNLALVNGGGLFNLGSGTVTILNSTFSHNTASSDGGGLINLGTCVIANSTLTANRIGNALNDGGGLTGNANVGNEISTILISTIVAGNFKGNDSDPAEIGGQ